MAMKRCPVCGERYSDTYKNCPFCEEEEYWEEEEPRRRPILREGTRSPSGRSAYSVVTPVLIVLIVLMAALLVYLLYGDKIADKFSGEDGGDGKPGISAPKEPDVNPTPGNTPAGDPAVTDPDDPDPDASSEPGETETPDDGSMPEGGNAGGTNSGGTSSGGTSSGGTSSGGTNSGGTSGTSGMSYASAAALPGGLTLSRTDFSRKVSEGDWQLKVSGGTGTYTWISENPSIAKVSSDEIGRAHV